MSDWEEAADILSDIDALQPGVLLERAGAGRRRHHGELISYSRKVFIPLTRLCRDVCGYCTFATTPGKVEVRLSYSPEEVLAIAQGR